MNLSGEVKKLTIIVGESERVYQRPLYEVIIYAAKKYKLAGSTIVRGDMSYGADNLLHSSKIFALSDDVPVIIWLVDVYERLFDFAKIVNRIMDKAGGGGLIFMEDVEVLRYGKINTEG
ncbi:DUF190 domain-containing protein [Thermophagus xiamenensis]|uniref:Uncharacterized protein n=1 Tax=Thermophagus xiamenensis TaxID=385682 RepID=A0A1I1YWI8_9BACT|nr:DUF190 domain-containing protein [Thermophagus xiamenensis]SFE23839.1 hypothetical protein SAMN05444380_108147 [Thermophagus xiamenensis]